MGGVNGDDTLRALTRFLDRCSVAGLATVSEAGVPHASNVVFACDPQAHLYFLSAAESCHADQIDRSGVAAVSVYAHDGPLTGVQARGPCRLQTGRP